MKVWSKPLTFGGADTSQLTPSDALGHPSGTRYGSPSASVKSGTHVNACQRSNAGTTLRLLSSDVSARKNRRIASRRRPHPQVRSANRLTRRIRRASVCRTRRHTASSDAQRSRQHEPNVRPDAQGHGARRRQACRVGPCGGRVERTTGSARCRGTAGDATPCGTDPQISRRR